jgi:Ca2+-binding RTX toxin-like protein
MAFYQGTEGDDALTGKAPDDVFDGKGGDDVIVGNGGIDRVIYTHNFEDYTITYDPATRQYTVMDETPGRDGTDLVRAVEEFSFLDGLKTWGELVPHQGDGVVLRGDATGNFLEGGTGLDKLFGNDGNDGLDGKGADDSLNGGNGNDILVPGGGDDVVEGGAGDLDRVIFPHNFDDYTISYDPGTHQYTVMDETPDRDGTDLVRGVEEFSFLDGMRTWGEVVPHQGDGVVRRGDATDNFLEGGTGLDKLYGNDGHDGLDAKGGDDYLSGGNGTDILVPGGGDDVVEGGGGDLDRVIFPHNFDDYTISYDPDTHQYTVMDETPGRDGTDLVRGVEEFSFLDGMRTWGEVVPHQGDGLVLRDDAASNFLQGGTGLDKLYGLDGNDGMEGRGADDFLAGGNGDDMMFGGTGDDTLVGGAGNDTLSGGEGVDQLQGQSGSDTFVFDAPLWGDMDIVADFATAFDTFRLHSAVFSALSPGGLDANAFQSAASTVALTTEARILFDTASGNLYYDSDGMGGVDAVAFATVAGLSGSLTHNDFIVS